MKMSDNYKKKHFDDQLTTKHDQRKTYAHDVDFPECGEIEFLLGQTIKAISQY